MNHQQTEFINQFSINVSDNLKALRKMKGYFSLS